jgi:hypothetical protein
MHLGCPATESATTTASASSSPALLYKLTPLPHGSKLAATNKILSRLAIPYLFSASNWLTLAARIAAFLDGWIR